MIEEAENKTNLNQTTLITQNIDLSMYNPLDKVRYYAAVRGRCESCR